MTARVLFTAVALSFASAACGARTGVELDPQRATPFVEGGAAGAPGAGGSQGGGGGHPKLEYVEGPFVAIGAELGTFTGAKVVARTDGVDVLANRSPPGMAVLARHAAVQPTKPSVAWHGAAQEILPGVVSGVVAASNADELAICHHQFNGDPTSFSTFAGAYTKTSGPTPLFGQSSCVALAYQNGAGLLALHKLPPGGGCCSRVELFDVDGHGAILPKAPALALPDGEFSSVRVTAYAGGFAWAGLADHLAVPTMIVRFRRGTELLSNGIPLTFAPETPDVAEWPFDAAAAVSFARDATSMRLVVMRESGELVVDDALTSAAGEHVQRAPLAASPYGLVTAYARCPADFSAAPGTIVVELRRPGEPVQIVATPVSCHAFVLSLAVSGNVVFALFSTEKDIQGLVLRITP